MPAVRQAYLASEGDESEEDAEPPGRALHDKYRTLLLAGDGNCAERKGGKVWATANGHAADSAHGSSSSDEVCLILDCPLVEKIGACGVRAGL